MLTRPVGDGPSVAAHCADELRRATTPVVAFWCVSGISRNRMAEQVSEAATDVPLITFVVPEQGFFRNANAVNADVMRVLDASREAVEGLGERVVDWGCIGILFISAGPLDVTPLPSDETLPGWFPLGGGTQVPIGWHYVNESMRVPFNSGEFDNRAVARGIYYLDRAIVQALLAAHSRGNAEPEPFRARLKAVNKKTPSWELILDRAQQELARVINLEGHRPEARKFSCPSDWSLKLVTENRPIDMGDIGQELCLAMGIRSSAADLPFCLVSRLCQSGRPDTFDNQTKTLGQGLICTLHAAGLSLTLINAHSGYMPNVLPLALAGLTADLVDSVGRYRSMIEHSY